MIDAMIPGHGADRRAELDEPIQRSNLGDDVYRILWERILDRRLRAGEKVSDLRLSDELGVSRTPVREALQRLVRDGIVRAEPNRGFYVASFSAADVAEIYDLRAGLEAMALRIAAPTLPADDLRTDLANLDRVERRLAAAATREERLAAAEEFLEVDRGFHRWLVEQAGNKRLAATVEGLWAQIAVFQQAGSLLPSLLERSIEHHRAIIAALLDGRHADAVGALERHIGEVKVRVLGTLAAGLAADDNDDANETGKGDAA